MSEPLHTLSTSPIRNETRDLILHIRQRRWKYFIIVIALGAYFFYFFKYQVLEYSSTASFVVNEANYVSSTLLDQGNSNVDNFNKIYELVNSIPTQKHIIDKFNLLAHYGIDSTNEFYFEKAVAKLRSKITVKKNPYNTISITVTDKYRYLTAEIANEMVAYIEKQNQDYYITTLKKKIQISEAYVSQLEKDNNKTSAGIDSLIKKINLLIGSGHLSERSNNDLIVQEQKLNELVFAFQNSTKDLINSQKLYNISLQALNFGAFPTLNIMGMAMPAYRSTAVMAMLYSVLAMILVFMLLVLQGYLFIYYKEYIRLILTGK